MVVTIKIKILCKITFTQQRIDILVHTAFNILLYNLSGKKIIVDGLQKQNNLNYELNKIPGKTYVGKS